jgi:hypothetical protein
VKEDQTNWDEWVPFAAYACNTSEHSATGYTPFELVFGHPSSLLSALRSEPSPQYHYDDYVSELKGRFQTAHHVAKKNLIASKVRSKDYYGKGTEMMKIEVGDKVLLYNETVRRDRSRKLSSQWIGPYEVVEVNKVNATIKKGRKLLKVHVNRLKPFC